jgi:hypothetical protein
VEKCLLHPSAGKERKAVVPSMVAGEQFSVEGGTNGRTQGKRFSHQNNAELF